MFLLGLPIVHYTPKYSSFARTCVCGWVGGWLSLWHLLALCGTRDPETHLDDSCTTRKYILGASEESGITCLQFERVCLASNNMPVKQPAELQNRCPRPMTFGISFHATLVCSGLGKSRVEVFVAAWKKQSRSAPECLCQELQLGKDIQMHSDKPPLF